MANISVTQVTDASTADAADINTPINTIVNEINGNLDNSNISATAAIAGSKIADASITPAKRTGGFAAGMFTRTTNGTQTFSGITGFDFTPRWMEFNAIFNHGAATSNQGSHSTGYYDITNNTQGSLNTAVRADGGAGSYDTTAYCIRLIIVSSTGVGSEAGRAVCSAAGNGTFTLTFTDVNVVGMRVIWKAYA